MQEDSGESKERATWPLLHQITGKATLNILIFIFA